MKPRLIAITLSTLTSLFFNYPAFAIPPHSKLSPSCCEKTTPDNTPSPDKLIYLISVSSQYDEDSIPEIKQIFSSSGYNIDTTYLHQNPTPLGYTDTDKARADTLIKALTDKKVKYLWFVRGGEGALNLYPYLYAKKAEIAKSTPKILIGFSDVTAIHYYVNNVIKWPSVHGVFASYNKEMHAIDPKREINMYSSINDTFSAISKGVTYNEILPMNAAAHAGATGIASGSNLTLIKSFFSTKYEEQYSGKILLLEDINEAPQQLDRALHQLSYKKNFHPKAIIFGQFYKDDLDEKSKQLYENIISDFSQKNKYPVYYYPKFGHGYTNSPFLLARKLEITCKEKYNSCSLKQSPLYQHLK
ncbi:LD-carboxypeptidase [Dickeya poaceiphila]|uniref:LD-carboxypeptidase n=1 Tax=Dickeya poaceiphila TaxID=568768 RepID=A0A5B8HGM9_9GAMM|nr:LD-carboxypeptidase [Dickeya poaceiphila]QDX29235.1 LD-carboxypeptidase [Dickeya poaceiphila]